MLGTDEPDVNIVWSVSDDDNIVLTKHEARQLFDKFGEWIVEP